MSDVTIILEGSITPHETSPLATAPMRPDRETRRDLRYPEGSEKTARLPRMPAIIAGGESVYTAYFPSSGIRGKLRRMARNALSKAQPGGWSIDFHRYLTVGGVKGSESEGDFNLDRVRRLREVAPLISLFGATSDMGQAWVAGRINVGHAMPETPLSPTIVRGVRTDDFRRNTAEVQFLSEEAAQALTDLAEAERRAASLRRKSKEVERNLKTAKRAKDQGEEEKLAGELNAINSELEVLSESLSSDVSVQLPLEGYEVIPPETPLRHRMILKNVNSTEIGLLLAALKEFSGEPVLGAHFSQGCGVVRCQWTVSVLDQENPAAQELGTIEVMPYRGVKIDGPDLRSLCEDAQQAFDAYLARVSQEGAETMLTQGKG